MKKLMLELAEKAGFCMWEDEPYGPGPGNIDWASGYDAEMVKFTELLLAEVVTACQGLPEVTYPQLVERLTAKYKA